MADISIRTDATEVTAPADADAVEMWQGELPGIRTKRGFKFRQGQDSFLRKFAAALKLGDYYHLGVFVPGYGKTITALSSFVVANAMGLAQKLIVFVPRGNLRDQYADPRELAQLFHNIGAPRFSFCVADSQRVFLKNRSTQIIITTYQYASGASGNRALKEVCENSDCMFVFDEVHHLSDDGTWAESIQRLPFRTSVALSGTPMRSDNKSLFGVPFQQGIDGQAYYRALHEVNMRDAHTEGKILKRVKAHVVDYNIVLTNSLTFQRVEMPLSKMMEIAKNKNELDTFLARRQLRFHEVYLETLLQPAFEQFEHKRRQLDAYLEHRGKSGGRNCQMLIIAMSNKHAAAIHEFVQKRFRNYSSTRIGQDVPERERLKRLEEYRSGQVDVMVQVDMIGEGTDIKTISLIVKADLVRAYSKTMQQIFRGMRWYKDFDARSNVCDIYASNDAELVKILEWITSEEKIGIKGKEVREDLDLLPGESKGPAQPQWELTGVAHHNTESHNLELFPGFGIDPDAPPPKRESVNMDDEEEEFEPGQVLDVAARENQLRQECSGLAARLAFTMQSDGKKTDVRLVHSAAMRRFGKAQELMSLDELRKKYSWLQSCVAARRII